MSIKRIPRSLVAGFICVMMSMGAVPTGLAQEGDTVEALNEQVGKLNAQGKYKEAVVVGQQSLALAERTLRESDPQMLTAIDNLAVLLRRQSRYGEAERLCIRALAIKEKALGKDDDDTLDSVLELATVYRAQGRYREAEPLHRRAAEMRERIFGKEHPSTLEALDGLAILFLVQGRYDEAEPIALRAKEAAERTLGKENAATLRYSGNLGSIYRDQGRYKEAEKLFVAEVETRERQDLVAEWQRRDALRNAALGEAPDKRDAKAHESNLARLAQLDERIAGLDKRLAGEFPDYASLARPGALSVEEVQAQLAPDEALVMFLDTPQWRPAPNESFIWVVTRTDARWARSDLGTEELSREVAALRCGLDAAAWEGPRCPELTGRKDAGPETGQPLPFDMARAHRLYLALFGSTRDLIKGKQLLLVPSGPLTQLPFQVLVTAPATTGDYRNAAWLMRDHALTVLPAVSSLKALRRVGRPSSATMPLIGFGNPLLDGSDARDARLASLAREKQRCPDTAWQRVAGLFTSAGGLAPVAVRGGHIDVAEIRHQTPLPETADELCAVARDVGADVSELRLGARATETEVKALSESGKLAQFRILHFATHGAMAGDLTSISEPGLVLTPPGEPSEADDGYLSASEIAALKLDADWVILSACNTAAASAPNAEALSGLARAFIYAQARALLVSHWAVNSSATVKLITASMREIARDRKVGRAEALRRAMLALADKGEPYETHPAIWVPFIVVGDGRRYRGVVPALS